MKLDHLVMFALGLTVMAFPLLAANEDAALYKACPELSEWAAKHPREERDIVNSGSTLEPTISSETRTELARRADLDQGARAFLSGGQAPSKKQLEQLAEVDADNLRWIKNLVTLEGFPTVEQVGRQGVSNAWLLVQHADADPAFQQAVLEVLMANSSTTGVRKADVAMLSDRVHLAQGKPQRYGTQFFRNEKGDLVPQEPIEDPTNLDARRAQVDLMPIELYRCVLRATYD